VARGRQRPAHRPRQRRGLTGDDLTAERPARHRGWGTDSVFITATRVGFGVRLSRRTRPVRRARRSRPTSGCGTCLRPCGQCGGPRPRAPLHPSYSARRTTRPWTGATGRRTVLVAFAPSHLQGYAAHFGPRARRRPRSRIHRLTWASHRERVTRIELAFSAWEPESAGFTDLGIHA
jgi:hypothetical protein